jgi:4-hydroxy-tetrahydrodipicolinate synthase
MSIHPAAAALRDRLRWRLVAAAATPLSAGRSLDVRVLDRYLRSLVDDGADALAVLVHTGRGPFLDEPTRQAVLATAVATGVPVVAGAGSPKEAETAAMAGASGLLVFAPDGGDPLAAHDALWRAAQLPLIAFDLYANPYPPDVLADLLAFPGVAGLKVARLHDALACQAGIAASLAAGRLAVTGEDRMFGPSLLWGAQAALVGIAAAAVPATSAPLRAFAERRYADFVAASARLDRLAAATFREPVDGYVQRMLWIAAAEGRIPQEFETDHFGPPLGLGERDRVLRTLSEVLGELR